MATPEQEGGARRWYNSEVKPRVRIIWAMSRWKRPGTYVMSRESGSDLDILKDLLLVRDVRVVHGAGVVGDLLVALVVERHAGHRVPGRVMGLARGLVGLHVVAPGGGVHRWVDEVLQGQNLVQQPVQNQPQCEDSREEGQLGRA